MVYETLKRGDYARGLELFENRESRLQSRLQRLPFPEWRGEDISGKRVMVLGEQGLGDEIQMARFIPALRGLGASRVFLLCHELNIRLLASMTPLDFVAPRRGVAALPDYDYWVGMLSLPYLLKVRPETLAGTPYIPSPDVPRTGGVGLVWTGSAANLHQPSRSLPTPDLLSEIPAGVLLEPYGDMLDSARQLAGLDALVTVCTSWAHLAGAMGLPVHVLLCHDADWRWGLNDRTPWYDSARLYRQAVAGSWTGPIAAARAALS